MAHRNNSFQHLLLLLVLTVLITSCSLIPDRLAGSGSETILGNIIDSRTGKKAANARIQLLAFSDTSTKRIDSTQSDQNGQYSFIGIPPGSYLLDARSADSKTVLLKQIIYTGDSTPLDVGTDTLTRPGAIRGVLLGEGQLIAKAFCYLRSTPYFDVSGNDGEFYLNDIQSNTYVLRIVPPEPFALVDTQLTINANAVCSLGTIILSADPQYPPPQVQHLEHEYDTALSQVNLTWKPSSVSDLAGYFIYRRTKTTGFEKISAILSIPKYSDSITTEHMGTEFLYAIKAIDVTGMESVLYSNIATVQTVSPSIVQTHSIFKLASEVADTITIGDTILVQVQYENPTRRNQCIQWFADSLGTAFQKTTVNTYKGIDTAQFVWKHPSNQIIIVQYGDEKGDVWLDTTIITVKGTLLQPGTWTRLPDAPFAGPVTLSGASGYTIYLVARCYASATRKYSIFSYNTRNNYWERISECPTNREGTGSAIYNNSIYVAGGITLQGQYSALVEIYDLETKEWTTGDSLRRSMKDNQLMMAQNSLYMFGGNHVKWFDRIDILDSLHQWTSIAYMNCDRSNFAIAKERNIIYLIGGQRFDAAINSVEAFNTSQEQCTNIAPLNFNREAAAAAIYNGSIYVFGGKDKSNVIDTCEQYSVDKNKWQKATVMENPRYNLAAATVDGVIYVIGGIDKDGKNVGIVEIYSP